jgi:alkylated DNA repair dioxygenase AlkB
VVWLGDFDYTYSGVLKKAQPWHPKLLLLKDALTKRGMIFNSCLCNYYHDGSESMGYHADDEKELGLNPTIASISLGAERLFYFKHRARKEVVKIPLAHGSLLIMQDEVQHHWLHSLPKMMRVRAPRINLTFRFIKKL